MPALIIILAFTGMFTLAFVAIVVETAWVVAAVGITHMVGFVVLMLLFMRSLHREERETAERERAEAAAENGTAAASPRAAMTSVSPSGRRERRPTGDVT